MQRPWSHLAELHKITEIREHSIALIAHYGTWSLFKNRARLKQKPFAKVVEFSKLKLFHKILFLPSCAVFKEKENNKKNAGARREQTELVGQILDDKMVLW